MSDPRGLFSIGEFSRITGITVKALRFYHDERLLVPTLIDPQTGYRYYADSLIERARVITYLRGLEFPLDQIREILKDASDDQRLLAAMEKHKAGIEARIRELRGVVRSLDQFITEQREVKAMSANPANDVTEKSVAPMLVAGVRMKGRYSDCGKGFAKIGRSFGRRINGPAMLLHYDTEYKEDDADFEACMPVKQSKSVDGVDVRQLPGCTCVCLTHHGPYDQMGPSYEKVIKYVKDRGYSIVSPTREVYLKGPGMIFKGNPRKYVTEIQIPIG
jgi:DNA-binding transcriptional MerR regulator